MVSKEVTRPKGLADNRNCVFCCDAFSCEEDDFIFLGPSIVYQHSSPCFLSIPLFIINAKIDRFVSLMTKLSSDVSGNLRRITQGFIYVTFSRGVQTDVLDLHCS